MPRQDRDPYGEQVQAVAAARSGKPRFDAPGPWASTLAAGVKILATDEVSGRDWAAVGAEPFIAS